MEAIKPAKAVTLSELLNITLQPREYMLSPLIQTQSIIMIFAARGLGKSWFCLQIAMSIAACKDFGPWGSNRSLRVLFIDGERAPVELQERVQLLAPSMEIEDVEAVPLSFFNPGLEGQGNPDLSTDVGQKHLAQLVSNCDIVIIDNLSTLFKGTANENEAAFATPINNWMLKLKREGKPVIIVHHAGKSGIQRGTSKLEDVNDMIINLKKLEGASLKGAGFKVTFDKIRGNPRELKDVEMSLISEGQEVYWQHKPINALAPDAPPIWIGEARELSEGGMSLREIAEQVKVPKSTLARHLKRL